MNILCDKPALLEEALGEGNTIRVHHSPPLDIYTPDSKILRTLKGMYFSSKLDFEDVGLMEYVREVARPLVPAEEPICHTCTNYEEFSNFCRNYIDTADTLRIAYDVETTAANYLTDSYRLAGFSLATSVKEGCYVILESLDYTNPDKEQILELLADVLKSHEVLVFNAQHEYIATNICVGVNLEKDTKQLDDAYAMSLLLKTESFESGTFKLKVLCNRLLGTTNWASIIDDYIDIAMKISWAEKFDFSEGIANLTAEQKELIVAFRDILKDYGYTAGDVVDFIVKLQEAYPTWQNQEMLPYTLIPSKLINRYGCFDSCYLLALFSYFKNWCKELDAKLQDSLNKPNIKKAYRDLVEMQVMSGILTVNGIFIDKDRNAEVESKSRVLSEQKYNELWDIVSDSTGKKILREYVKAHAKSDLEKKYILPFVIPELIPEGFEFLSTTPTLYSFECKILDESLIVDTGELDKQDKPVKYIAFDDKVKVYKRRMSEDFWCCKLLQKHLLPYSTLENEEELLDKVLDTYLDDCIKKDGSLSATAFRPMSGPDELFDLLNADFKASNFIHRVILFEHDKLAKDKQSARVSAFLEEHPLHEFDIGDTKAYIGMARHVKDVVFEDLSNSYSFKEIYENLVESGIKSFAAPIIEYIYNVYTATGCTVDEPRHSVFDFICKLKICRRYMRINSTFIYGSSGGYVSQMKVDKKSVYDKHLRVVDTTVLQDRKAKDKPYYTDDTESVVFGNWYAGTAETGRWQATIHNVPAGAYAKRRFVSRYPGGFILANDMSQAEVRELAAVSKCQELLATIKDPTVDIHKRTAALAFDVPYDEVTKDQRKQTKQGIFSIVYGREEDSLAQMLFKGDKAAAKRLMDAIFKVYPEIKEYLSAALEDAKKHGYLVTRLGTPLFINPFTKAEKEKGEGFRRNVQNYTIQSGASYWCSGTLHNVQKLIDERGLSDKIKVVCYIHDSIELDVAPDVLDEAMVIMNYAFNELATELYNVPTASDTVIGISMGEELDIKRIEKNYYIIEGNNQDVLDVIEQFRKTYDVEILNSEVDETIHQEEDIDWVFIARSEIKWYDEITPAKYEIKITPKQ